jgi:hypothetical protein
MTVLNLPHLDSKNAESREDCVRKDLTLRLKRVCENLSTAEFAALVVRMTREQLRSESISLNRLRPC